MSTRKITDTRHKWNETEYFKISIFEVTTDIFCPELELKF